MAKHLYPSSFSFSCSMLFLIYMFYSISFSSAKPLCPNEERYALLKFNQSISIRKSASRNPSAYPKVTLWIDTDCCFWYGVDCDADTGHVIGLDLHSSYLYGSITSENSLFRLVHLKWLNLADNNFNFSRIPSKFGLLSGLTLLNLSASAFSGQVPSEITQLSNLTTLDLSQNWNSEQRLQLNKFDFSVMVQNMTSLQNLDLSLVSISSTLPKFLGNLSSLTYLNLWSCNLSGNVPTSLGNLTKLSYLNLGENSFSGSLPLSLGSLSKLNFLNLQDNTFSGALPSWLANLTLLNYLSLSNNSFTPGSLSWVGNQKRLSEIWLNHLSLVGEIPSSICEFTRLRKLDLSYNQLSGQIPSCFSNLTTLVTLDLRSNLLQGFQQLNVLSSLTELQFFSVTSNKIQGTLPFLPPSLLDFCADQNSFVGEIPTMMCDLVLLVYLDVSTNSLSGTIPPCLGNLNKSLLVLNLANNLFHGEIPKSFANLSSLKLIDLGRNGLEGQLPRSLVDCQKLEVIVLCDNRIGGPFPYWLGDLPDLEVLILRSNQFNGAIGTFTTSSGFSKLRILDLSINNFTGSLPEELFTNLISMKFIDADHLAYLGINHSKEMDDSLLYTSYQSQMVLANKGVYVKYWQIPNVIAAMDLSSNKLQGGIPVSVGTLKMVNLLNLSNNHLSGGIPSTLANLSRLESLDLSRNILSGKIPMQLRQLTFLEYFNVSENQLAGPIPQGNQFDTFENTSYMGNLGLCGKPLTKSCESPHASPPPGQALEQKGKHSFLAMYWEIVLIGYGFGVVAGLVVGLRITPTKHEWFMKIFGKRKKQPRRRERRSRRRT